MYRWKKIVTVTLVLLASIFVIVGALTGFLVSEEKFSGEHTHSDSRIIPPKSNSSIDFEVTLEKSDLRIDLVANRTLMVNVFQNDELRWSWERSELKRYIFNVDTGMWIVSFQNNSSEKSCSYTCFVTVIEQHEELTKPYAWLRTPFFISAVLVFSLVPSIYIFDRIKHRLNMKLITTILIGIVICTFVFSYQIAGYILHTSSPWVVATGVSMEPTMQSGDLVIVKGIDPENLVVGDVILFQQVSYNVTSSLNGGTSGFLSIPVMHRIVNMLRIGNHTYFRTQGDNPNQKRDEWFVPEEGILGKAILIVPKLGLVVFWLSMIEVKLFLISLIIFGLFIWPSIKPRKKQDENKKAKRSQKLE